MTTATIDLRAAREYLARLTGSADTPCTWQTFGEGAHAGQPSLARVMHGPLDKVAAGLASANGRGAGVFVTVAQTDLRGRRSENVTGLRALFADCDAGEPPAEVRAQFPRPHAIVRSAAGPHYYWRLRDGEALDGFEAAQAAIAEALGSDPKVKDLPRVMRVPGFLHRKGTTPIMVTLDDSPADHGPYAIADVLGGIARAPAADPTALVRAKLYADKVPGAPKGQRNQEAYKLACKLVLGFALDNSDATSVMLDWSQRCTPPLTEREIVAVIRSARKHGTEPVGGRLGERQSVREMPAREAVTRDISPASDATTQQPRRAHPAAVADRVLAARTYVVEPNDNIYRYTGTHWTPITMDGLRSDCYAEDDANRTKPGRVGAIAMHVYHRCRRAEPIVWNSVATGMVPFVNGMLDLATGELSPHAPEHYLDRVIPHEWRGADAPAPMLWQRCLLDWFGEDADYKAKVDALQEYFGYVLLQHARYKMALMLYGGTDTGKTVIAEVMRAMVGTHQTCQISVEDMADARKRAPIVGKYLNLLTELSADALIADGGFKQLVSTGEALSIDEKFKSPIMYVPTCKHVIATNNLPRIDDKTRATFRRLLLIKCNTATPAERQDPLLHERLTDTASISGILAWAVEGARRLAANSGRFTAIPESIAEMEAYRAEQNPVMGFVAEMCIKAPKRRVTLRDITVAYNNWQVGGRPWSTRAMGRALRGADIEVERIGGIVWAVGVDLNTGKPFTLVE